MSDDMKPPTRETVAEIAQAQAKLGAFILNRVVAIIDRRERGNLSKAEHDLNKYDQIVGLIRREWPK